MQEMKNIYITKQVFDLLKKYKESCPGHVYRPGPTLGSLAGEAIMMYLKKMGALKDE